MPNASCCLCLPAGSVLPPFATQQAAMTARAVTVYRHLLAAVGSMKPGAQQSMLLQQVKGDFAKGRKLACPKK